MEPTGNKYKNRKFGPILPGKRNWPIFQLSRNRKKFIEGVIKESTVQVKHITKNRNALIEEIEVTLFKERLRIQQNPWKVDPRDELQFWEGIKSQLVTISGENGSSNKDAQIQHILRLIIKRYAYEIAGTFKPSSYRMARALITFGFARLLNASRVKGFRSLWSQQFTLQDKINIHGEAEHLRHLAKKGTIVMVPTHFSNMDAVLVGWIIHTLGLPPFVYGADLNLFNIGVLAYFMNSLGAYKVDRRKKNLLYMETLKAYSISAIKKGCHSLFFPGGSRSRSGKIEKSLKPGLLGTTIEAQRLNYMGNETQQNNKIFIVPVVLNYHFVLEAPSLIHEYLELKGQERYYVENDEFSNSYKIITFLIKFFTKGSDISVSIGKPMDILGNYVDEEGNSIDRQGRIIDPKDYFISNGKLTKDKQRDEEYTRMLGNAIVKEYHKINRIFSSHLVAFIAFEMLKKRHPKLDLYNFLRLPEEDLSIDYENFRETMENVRAEAFRLFEEGKVKVASHLHGDIDTVIEHGLMNVGMYHVRRPLLKNKKGDIVTEDLNTLYYYHNRLDGYGLKKFI